ncbi:glycosyltransferase family 2 protein [Actinospongicola halichondriae]|uniref:glycosyltransferase family 2 protein n=1 Tax=Actinospongicola halichondriae TaxID=3236844 RepID=UPI003D4F9C45
MGLSVIIPVRNRVDTLVRAITSVWADDDRTRVVVVDDGSDRPVSESLPNEVLERVELVRSDRWIGVSAARNLGIRSSETELVSFLDSDDEVLDGWAAGLVAGIAAADVICCGAEIRSETDTEVRLPRSLGPVYNHVSGLFLAGTYAVRRSLLDAVGGFDERFRFSENTDLALRLTAATTSIATIDRPLMRVHHRGRREEHDEGRYLGASLMVQEHRSRLARDPAHLAAYFSIISVGAERQGHLWAAISAQARALRLQPSWRNLVRVGRPVVRTALSRLRRAP